MSFENAPRGLGEWYNPLTWTNKAISGSNASMLSADFWKSLPGHIYETIQYGKIPEPPAPHVAAPQTRPQMTTPGGWTPEQAAAQTRIDQERAIRENIEAAERAGTYNPAGNLPQVPELADFEKWKQAALLAGCVIGGIFIIRGLKK